MVRPHDEPRLLFLYDTVRAMREPSAASHFGRVCAGSITGRTPPPAAALRGKCNSPINAFLTLTDVTKW
jgi:hypothetical protein